MDKYGSKERNGSVACGVCGDDFMGGLSRFIYGPTGGGSSFRNAEREKLKALRAAPGLEKAEWLEWPKDSAK